MRSVLLAALLTLGALFAPSAAQAQGQGGPCGMRDPAGRAYIALSGPWANHGATLDVFPQGCGVITWRDNRVLAFALDTRDGPAASGGIGIASPQLAIGPGIILTLAEDGTLTVEWDNEPRTFCRTWAWSPRCGA